MKKLFRKIVNQELHTTFFRDFAGIVFGSLLCGMSFSLFLVPFKASPGGVSGLAQIFFFFFHMPISITMLLFNIPLFIIGVIFINKGFGLKTIIAIVCVSLFAELSSYKYLSKIAYLKDFFYVIYEKAGAYSFTSEIFLAVLAGSLLLGAGIGIIIRFNGSTGGTDIPVLILRKYMGISVGNGYLIIETIIIFFIGIVFKNGNIILWGLLSLYISARVTDIILEGFSRSKALLIISNQSDQIKQFIIDEFERSCTILEGLGGYSNQNKKIIYAIIYRRELPMLKKEIKKVDPEAFVVVNEVYEVLGEGFKKL
ncbi:MAG: YitT family protein [Spirochaetes bacterium]|nr:YitT family protein [Spirochaetota bacterium]